METDFAQDIAGSREIHDGLEKVFKVSEYLDFPFTLEEVASYFLPRTNFTGEELRSVLLRQPFSDLPFHIRDGYLLSSANQSLSSRLEREQMSAVKLNSAAGFANVLRRMVPFIRTIAVTGSVAYGSADEWDDIDLFIVTKRNRLWLTALTTLFLVRLVKFFGLRPAQHSLFCLSYVHDEDAFAREALRNRTNPLFARELLKAKPVAGIAEYKEILQKNDWVKTFYATSYTSRLRKLNQVSANGDGVVKDEVNSGPFSLFVTWAESLTFTFLSRYLRIRAYLTNLKLKSQGQAFRVFEPKISAASCVYTSNFYEWLRALWGR